MSGKTGQVTPTKMPKTSPICLKQGPMKATIPMSSILKQGSTLRSSSATASLTYSIKHLTSPEHSISLHNPGSSVLKGRFNLRGSSPGSTGIRRTASLDTIYLKGQWPRDGPNWFSDVLQKDKATQTDDQEDLELRPVQSMNETDDDMEIVWLRKKFKATKERLTSSGEYTLSSSSQTLSTCPLTTKLTIPIKPLQRTSTRSSVEGLNQEIERIVLKTDSDIYTNRSDEFCRSSLTTPEGHRAPLAEILRQSRSRSVNTQTPQEFESFSPSSEDSQGSSPDRDTNRLGTSPRINKFLTREPPDGCEKVHLKTLSDKKPISFEHVPQPPSTFKLRPSLDSAFQILQPSSSQADESLPIVPPQKISPEN